MAESKGGVGCDGMEKGGRREREAYASAEVADDGDDALADGEALVVDALGEDVNVRGNGVGPTENIEAVMRGGREK